MRLSSADRSFVERRERRVRQWPVVGTGCLVLIAAYGAWLWWRLPYLINPWQVIESLEAGTLSESMMNVMVVMLPVVVAALLVFALVVVLLWFVALSNERRLLGLLRTLEAASGDGTGKGGG